MARANFHDVPTRLMLGASPVRGDAFVSTPYDRPSAITSACVSAWQFTVSVVESDSVRLLGGDRDFDALDIETQEWLRAIVMEAAVRTRAGEAPISEPVRQLPYSQENEHLRRVTLAIMAVSLMLLWLMSSEGLSEFQAKHHSFWWPMFTGLKVLSQTLMLLWLSLGLGLLISGWRRALPLPARRLASLDHGL